MGKYTERLKRGRLSGLITFHNSIDLNISKKRIDLDQPVRYTAYLVKFKWRNQIIKYIGKGVLYYNKDGTLSYKSRFLSHRDDAFDYLMQLVGPENCEVYTIENLTENQAKAVEAWLISLIDGTTMSYGQYRWRGEQFLNKRCEDVNRDLINYYNLDGNNDVESFRRKINNY